MTYDGLNQALSALNGATIVFGVPPHFVQNMLDFAGTMRVVIDAAVVENERIGHFVIRAQADGTNKAVFDKKKIDTGLFDLIDHIVGGFSRPRNQRQILFLGKFQCGFKIPHEREAIASIGGAEKRLEMRLFPTANTGDHKSRGVLDFTVTSIFQKIQRLFQRYRFSGDRAGITCSTKIRRRKKSRQRHALAATRRHLPAVNRQPPACIKRHAVDHSLASGHQ